MADQSSRKRKRLLGKKIDAEATESGNCMADKKHLAILKQGVEVWNNWKLENPLDVLDLRDADLSRTNLIGVDLRGVDLDGANFSQATFSREYSFGTVTTGGITGSYPSRMEISGTDFSGASLREANFYRANLRDVDLMGANLYKANLQEAFLCRANLRGAKLIGVNLSGADLSGVDFSGADLGMAIFCSTNLRDANLRGANFMEAVVNSENRDRAQIIGADLSRALVGFTEFTDVNLALVRGLETLKHDGPSIIGIDTIYRSGGKIPDKFLKGAGLPDGMIGYIHSIAGVSHFYSCFISYSTNNQEFADRLHADLYSKGVRCWFAPHDVKGGKKLHEQINQAIHTYDKLLLILSDSSMKSEWVKTEIAEARQRELREERQMLFPIALVPYEQIQQWKAFDADTGKDSAREIREYYIPDFSNWKDHDSYQKAFDRLLRDLNAEKGS
jgi:uncharacterized protein YjbI with pentapeptide repeats